jgi:hypothetical protein
MKVYKKLLPIFVTIIILLPLFVNTHFNVKAQPNYKTYYFTTVNAEKFFMGYNPNKQYFIHDTFLGNEYLIILLNGNLMIFKKSGNIFMNMNNVSLPSTGKYGLFKYNSSHVGVYGDYGGFKVYLINLQDYTVTGTNTLGGFISAIYLYSYGTLHFFAYSYFLYTPERGTWVSIVKLSDTTLTKVDFYLSYANSPEVAAAIIGFGYFNPSNNRLYIGIMTYDISTYIIAFDLTSNNVFKGGVGNAIAGVLNGKFLSYGMYLYSIDIIGSIYNLYLSVTGTWKLTNEPSYSTRDAIVRISFKDNGNSITDITISIFKEFIQVQQMSFAGSYPFWDCVYSFYFYEPTKSYFQVIRNYTKGSADYGAIDVPNLSFTYPFWFNTWGFAQLCNNNQDLKLYVVSGTLAITITPGQTVTTTTYYPTTTYYTSQPFTSPETNIDFITNAIIPLTIVSIPALLLTAYLGAAGLIVGLLLGGGILVYSGYAPFGLIFLIVLGAVIVLWRGYGKGDGG